MDGGQVGKQVDVKEEIMNTVIRAIQEHHDFNHVLLEVKALKFAHDASFRDCVDGILRAYFHLSSGLKITGGKTTSMTGAAATGNIIVDLMEFLRNLKQILEGQSRQWANFFEFFP